VRSFPGSTYDGAEVPVNPADGQVIERTFDPYLLGKRLAQLGFDVRVSGHWAAPAVEGCSELPTDFSLVCPG
jgi:hypothetical protein